MTVPTQHNRSGSFTKPRCGFLSRLNFRSSVKSPKLSGNDRSLLFSRWSSLGVNKIHRGTYHHMLFGTRCKFKHSPKSQKKNVLKRSRCFLLHLCLEISRFMADISFNDFWKSKTNEKVTTFTRWWLNHPSPKICSSNWIMEPQGSGSK